MKCSSVTQASVIYDGRFGCRAPYAAQKENGRRVSPSPFRLSPRLGGRKVYGICTMMNDDRERPPRPGRVT